MLDKLRSGVEREIRAWAAENGLKNPAPVVFAPPPPHVDADICMPWPMSAAKALKRKPLDIAASLAEKISSLPEIGKSEPAPPGFVNLTLNLSGLTDHLRAVLSEPEKHGREENITARSIIIEYVSANPTGPVHLASGRAATLGDSLAKILRRRGHSVATEFYVNDAGRQVRLLGESVKARHEEAAGKDSPVPEDGYQGDYIKDIANAAPAEASAWSAEEFSKFAIEQMLAAHRSDMALFGVVFDRWYLESELHERKALDASLKRLKDLGRVKEKDGAVWLSMGDDAEDDKDRVLVRADGRPTYFLADIAYHQDKLERGFKELIDIWGADHHGYVPRMKDAITALGYPKETFLPIVHQLVRLFKGTEAVKMSKRAGEFVTLRELVEDVGLDACRYFFAKHSPNSHMNFDIELAKKQTQENPVYYVQYVHARIRSIFREAPAKGIEPRHPREDEWALLTDPTERDLLKKIAWFPEALKICERDLSPHPLTTYLGELAGLYHAFYEKCKVLSPESPNLSTARLALCGGVAAVIKDGLGLLGVRAPEKM